jgi:hypothetical protein
MNPNDPSSSRDDFQLRRHLRNLPHEREPGRELWSGIEARIATTSPARRTRAARRWFGLALAAAASLTLAIATLLRPELLPLPGGNGASSGVAGVSNDRPAPSALRFEADAMTIEYRTALDGFTAAPLSPALQAAATELDASAAQLREALRAQPDATYLLDRLRHTYDQRLKLTQRAVLG